MINDQGGVGGRKIVYDSVDDGYSPPRTVEQVRKLVEQDEVAFIFATIGTPTNTAIAHYMNSKGVPLLFLGSGANKWGDLQARALDHGLAAELPDRGADLHEVYPEAKSRTRRSASCIRTMISAKTIPPACATCWVPISTSTS